MAIGTAQKLNAIWISQANLFTINPTQQFEVLLYFNISFQRVLHSAVCDLACFSKTKAVTSVREIKVSGEKLQIYLSTIGP